MRILVSTRGKRTLALESEFHVLLFRYIHHLKKCAIELVSKDNFNKKHFRSLSKRKPSGFLGLIEMNGNTFLCVITGRASVASPLENEIISKIMDVEFHCLTKDTWDFLDLNNNGYPSENDDGNGSAGGPSASHSNHNSDGSPGSFPQRIEQNPCYELRKLLVDGSFFYSTDFDLTSTLQMRGVENKSSLSFDRYHVDYMWNSFMMEEIINFRNNLDDGPKRILDHNKFLTTVIRGFAESFDTRIGNERAKLTIISKQSWKRAGTRFNVRGVDDDGNVANFVETECIYNDKRYIYSFTQIRGSIPIFWEQDTALISPKVQITRSFDATSPVFEKHFEKLNAKYGPVHIVDLLSTKTSEIELSKRYKEHFNELSYKKPDTVYLSKFDFHQETSKTYANAVKVLALLQESLDEFSYFCYDKKYDTLVSEQQGVFRTNCLDCLDRTNVVQQVISMAALEEFVHKYRNANDSDIQDKHRTLWADHGDQISQIYTGTNALKSSFSRSGKMGFAGALSDVTKSVSRIYINNFVDKGKQVVTDTLLGKNSDQSSVVIFDPVTDYVNEELKKIETQFTTKDSISLYVGSYNLAAASSAGDLTPWLFPRENGGSKFSPDVMVIGFQEVVELNASNVLTNDSSKSAYWRNLIESQINKVSSEKYVLLRTEFMSSILIFLYVKSENMAKITQVEGKSKKTGLGGIAANKGSVALRFDYGSSSFCFFNSHLAAGTTNTDERYSDFMTSWNGIRFSRNRLIKDHDNIIWLGDLNYRISKPNDEVRSQLAMGNISELLNYDQLMIEMRRRDQMRDFVEHPINFIPTYKFDKGTTDYDSSEKQRIPSWTDRILYQGNYLTQLNYNCVPEIMFSDHKPIYGTFTSQVKLVDSETKKILTEKLYAKFKTISINSKDAVLELNDQDISSAEDEKYSKSTLLPDFPSSSSSVSSTSPPPPSNVSAPAVTPRINVQQPLRRKLPPPYDPKEVNNVLIPGLSSNYHSNISQKPQQQQQQQQSTKPEDQTLASAPPTPAPRKLPPAPHGFSMAVMQPSRSLNGSPISTPPPPAPPPRRVLGQHEQEETQTSSHPKKIAPIVPIKPKVLSNVSTSASTPAAPTGTGGDGQAVQSAAAAPPANTWSAMTPTKRL